MSNYSTSKLGCSLILLDRATLTRSKYIVFFWSTVKQIVILLTLLKRDTNCTCTPEIRYPGVLQR